MRQRDNIPGVFSLIKITDNEDHAHEFQQGIHHCNRVSWFRDMEYDKFEGGFVFPFADKTVFKIDGYDIAPFVHFPIALFNSQISNLNLFCMTAVHPGPYSYETITDDNSDEFVSYLKIDERCREEFGEHAVVIMDVTEFLNRVRRSTDSKKYQMAVRLVDYFEPHEDLEIDPNSMDPVFYKRDLYKYQKEFRIAINSNTVGTDPLRLNIGSIEDISFRMDTGEINDKMSVSFE